MRKKDFAVYLLNIDGCAWCSSHKSIYWNNTSLHHIFIRYASITTVRCIAIFAHKQTIYIHFLFVYCVGKIRIGVQGDKALARTKRSEWRPKKKKTNHFEVVINFWQVCFPPRSSSVFFLSPFSGLSRSLFVYRFRSLPGICSVLVIVRNGSGYVQKHHQSNGTEHKIDNRLFAQKTFHSYNRQPKLFV